MLDFWKAVCAGIAIVVAGTIVFTVGLVLSVYVIVGLSYVL